MERCAENLLGRKTLDSEVLLDLDSSKLLRWSYRSFMMSHSNLGDQRNRMKFKAKGRI